MKRKKEDLRQILQADAAFVCLFVTKRQNRLSLHGSCWQLPPEQIRATFSANPRSNNRVALAQAFPRKMPTTCIHTDT